jgi:hypothetical protein
MGQLLEMFSGAAAAKTEAKSAQNIANYRAQVKEREAKAIKQETVFAQKRQAKRGAEVISTLEAKLGEGITSPVAADLIAEQKAELELENIIIGYKGGLRAQRAKEQAKLERAGGRQVKLRGRNLALARNISFATGVATTPYGSEGKTLLTGF